MSNINTTDIHNLRAEITRRKKEVVDGGEQDLLEKVELALLQLLNIISEFSDENIRLKMSVEELQAKKPIKQIESSYLRMILAKVEILRNLIRETTGNQSGELFSTDLIAVESIEKDINETSSVSKDQLKELNQIYKKYSQKSV